MTLSIISGFIGVYLGYWLREKNENDQEEYVALLTTKDLLDADPIDLGEITKFYKKLRINLRARKLDTYEIMKDALLKEIEKKDYSMERDKIVARLDDLKKKRIIQRIKSRFNKASSQSPPAPPRS